MEREVFLAIRERSEEIWALSGMPYHGSKINSLYDVLLEERKCFLCLREVPHPRAFEHIMRHLDDLGTESIHAFMAFIMLRELRGSRTAVLDFFGFDPWNGPSSEAFWDGLRARRSA